MSDMNSSPVARRGFLARLSMVAGGLATVVSWPERLRASPALNTATDANPDAWIDRLTGSDRLVFHTHQNFVAGLVGARNVIANGRDLYGVPERDNSVAVATHGPAIIGLFNDALWQQFALGERYKISDPKTGAPSTRNVFLTPQDGEPPDATVPDLMQHGVLFLVCNVALRGLSRRIAREPETPEAMHKELVAGILPGVIVVPDLFVALSHAQKKGVSYIFLDTR